MTIYATEPVDRFDIRFPEGLRDTIKASARANNRSMRSEINTILQDHYNPPQSDRDAIAREIKRLADILASGG